MFAPALDLLRSQTLLAVQYLFPNFAMEVCLLSCFPDTTIRLMVDGSHPASSGLTQ